MQNFLNINTIISEHPVVQLNDELK